MKEKKGTGRTMKKEPMGHLGYPSRIYLNGLIRNPKKNIKK